jgi:predicted unusual protein kinase regulating ubiquinone biosynthesis (AarF/ABC1/UbiB family)
MIGIKIFRDGFCHAHPHPGNSVILAGGVVGVLDCGMVGHLDVGLRSITAAEGSWGEGHQVPEGFSNE